MGCVEEGGGAFFAMLSGAGDARRHTGGGRTQRGLRSGCVRADGSLRCARREGRGRLVRGRAKRKRDGKREFCGRVFRFFVSLSLNNSLSLSLSLSSHVKEGVKKYHGSETTNTPQQKDDRRRGGNSSGAGCAKQRLSYPPSFIFLSSSLSRRHRGLGPADGGKGISLQRRSTHQEAVDVGLGGQRRRVGVVD